MAWELDNAHTSIMFAAKHMMVTTVRGQFKKFSGIFDLNEQNPTASKVDVTIDAASLDTGTDYRDTHLRSADFFDVEKYPTITFKSTRVEAHGTNEYTVYGNLTVHGVTREIPLHVSHEGVAKSPQGKRITAFVITGSLSRKDFGLNWNVALESGGWLVSDKININIETELIEAASPVAQEAAR